MGARAPTPKKLLSGAGRRSPSLSVSCRRLFMTRKGWRAEVMPIPPEAGEGDCLGLGVKRGNGMEGNE